MKSDEYWALRALQREAESHDGTTDSLNRLAAMYSDANKQLVKMIERIFLNFQKYAAVDDQKARELLSVQETAELLTELRKRFDETGNAETLAKLNARTCYVCGALDLKTFLVSEAKTGINLPPMHPNDRCTTVPKIPGADADGERIARDPETGRNYKVPAGTTYEEWRKCISEKYGADSLEKAQKKYLNRKADAKQLKDLKKVIGKDAPKDLAELQDWKYNDPERFKFVCLDYQRRMSLLQDPSLKLPNAGKTTAADAKFEKYLFGGVHPEGLAKGAAFTSRLGYDINNWQNLRDKF